MRECISVLVFDSDTAKDLRTYPTQIRCPPPEAPEQSSLDSLLGCSSALGIVGQGEKYLRQSRNLAAARLQISLLPARL